MALALPPALLLLHRPLPQRPPGDLLGLVAGLGGRRFRLPELSGTLPARGVRPAARIDAVARAERRLRRWSVGGTLLPLLALVLFALLAGAG